MSLYTFIAIKAASLWAGCHGREESAWQGGSREKGRVCTLQNMQTTMVRKQLSTFVLDSPSHLNSYLAMLVGIGWAACGDEQASKAYTWRYPPSSPGCVLRRRLRLGNARKDSKAAAAGASRLLRRWEFPWIENSFSKVGGYIFTILHYYLFVDLKNLKIWLNDDERVDGILIFNFKLPFQEIENAQRSQARDLPAAEVSGAVG